MSLKAAFLWTKHPRCAISTMIFDSTEAEVLINPKICYPGTTFFTFTRDVRTSIKNFFTQIEKIYKEVNQPIEVEYKIVFPTYGIPFMKASLKSLYVLKLFKYYARQFKKRIPLKVKAQLRHRLRGKSLRDFKRELRKLYLVSRKRNTGYEYHLWGLALHATKSTYKKQLVMIRNKMVEKVWRN